MNRQTFLSLWALAGASLLGGCVEREMTITSEPAGALVYVSSEPIGRTPVTKKFTWYGDYEIILRYPEKGYKTLKTHANINAPWYEVPPLDLISAIVPWTIPDKRYLPTYKLEKLPPGSEAEDEKLIERATQMEKRNLQPAR